jgi:6-phosphogluconolactonase
MWKRNLLALGVVLSQSASIVEGSDMIRLFIGTYSGPQSKGIYTTTLDRTAGTLSEAVLAAEVKNPSFLAISPKTSTLYAVSEMYDASGPAVSAFAIDRQTGVLAFKNQLPSGGKGPCYVSVDSTSRFAFLANYGAGTVSSYKLAEDGALASKASTIEHAGSSVNPQRQKEPHAHSIVPAPGGQFVLAADLGTDEVISYAVDQETGALSRAGVVKPLPGSGPRHIAFAPSGKIVYVVNELLNTVDAFRYDAGKLTFIAGVNTLPSDFTGVSTTAEIAVHPSGQFVYCSNRGQDSISVFSVQADGSLKRIENTPTQGSTPRHFAIDPSGKFLLAANQKSDTVVVFAIDAAKGTLTPTGSTLKVATPVCVRFLE